MLPIGRFDLCTWCQDSVAQNSPCNVCVVNGQQRAIFMFTKMKSYVRLHQNLSWPLNLWWWQTWLGPPACNPHLLAAHCTCVHPPTILTLLVANYLWISSKSEFWHCCICVNSTMVSFLCLLFGFVGQAIGAGIPENLENEICKNSNSGICNLRASWGYLASNGPVQDRFFLLNIPDSFPSQATWPSNYGEAQGGFCDGANQSPIDLDSSVAVLRDPGAITMVTFCFG